jgi:hypothetical protein
VIFIALIATNVGWIYYEQQFITEEVTQDVDTGNGAAVVAGIGDIYGTDQADSEKKSP